MSSSSPPTSAATSAACVADLRRAICNGDEATARSAAQCCCGDARAPRRDRRLLSGLAAAAAASSAAADQPPFDINLTSHYESADARTPILRTLLYLPPNDAIAQLLLDAGARTDVRDKYGRTPMHIAAEKQRKDVVSCLYRHSPQLLLAQDDAGNIPLHDATSVEFLRLLLSLGSPVDSANNLGDTALHIAARSGRLELARTLLELGASAHALNHAGRMPLHNACENGFKNIVLSGDHEMHARGWEDTSMRNKRSPLLGLFLLRLLLSSAVSPPLDVNRADAAGWTPLHNACLGGYPEHESHTPIVSLLLAYGADVHAQDCAGMRPIHVTTDTSALRLLLAAGADPHARDHDGRTPLHNLGADSCVVLLELPGALLHVHDRYHRTPLHVASDPEKTRLLVAKGANMDARDEDGKTPLDWAIATERPEVEAMLRSFGAHRGQDLSPTSPTTHPAAAAAHIAEGPASAAASSAVQKKPRGILRKWVVPTVATASLSAIVYMTVVWARVQLRWGLLPPGSTLGKNF